MNHQEFEIIEIIPAEIDTRVAECICAVWGDECTRHTVIENCRNDFAGKQDSLLLIARDAARHVKGFRFAHTIPPDGAVEGFRFTDNHLPDGFDNVLYDNNGGVHPDSRRQGLGRALLQKQHALAKARGYATITTATALNLVPMIILNLQDGFEIVDIIDAQTETWQTRAVLFRKEL